MALKKTITVSSREIHHIPELQKIISQNLQKPITKVLDIILSGALSLSASDVHFEPEENGLKIRLRIDGVLQNLILLPKSLQEKLVSRVKLISGIKLNITERPQDGRFSILWGKGEIEVRVSSLPSPQGESIVMRLLNPQEIMDIENLGIRKEDLSIINKEIKKPNGMIIVTGPTGSGKTTTLYAFLKKINRPEIKIITIEDPIEYKLEGVSQTQVEEEKGYDFASGLKSIMRQDPDVILVGEIRDAETAKIAIQAALTGHLVLTTLHTSDAAGVVSRLIALGEKASNIAPALNFVIGQRLVRKVCPKCKKEGKITPEELQLLKKEVGRIREISSSQKVFEAEGCEYCNFTGYRGRTGIFELFVVDEEMKEFISSSPSIIALQKKLKERKFITIYQHGLLKVLDGITTFKEVERVMGEK